MLDGFYCKECKTEFEVPKHFRIPKVTNPTQFTEIYICPNCKGQNFTEIIDGETLESEVNKA